jgi:hypothetical protein
MAALTQEHRERLLLGTKRAAATLLPDLEHVERIVSGPFPSRDEIRWLSPFLRRILVDGILQSVVAPRLSRFTLRAPDNDSTYSVIETVPYLLFVSGGGGTNSPSFPMAIPDDGLPSFRIEILDDGQNMRKFTIHDPKRFIDLKIDRFLSQRVLYFHGGWISRRDVIKYIANVDGGVHAGEPKEPADFLLDRITQSVLFMRTADGYQINTNAEALLPASAAFRYNPNAVGVAYLELFAAAYFLSISPKVHRLVGLLKAELAGTR